MKGEVFYFLRLVLKTKEEIQSERRWKLQDIRAMTSCGNSGPGEGKPISFLNSVTLVEVKDLT